MEVSTEKEIERINIVDGKKEFSVKGIKGLKLFLLFHRRKNF